MNRYIYVIADTNDGDYVTKMSLITDEDVEKIKPVIKAVEDCKNYYNYPTLDVASGYDSADLMYGHLENFQLFDDFVPNGQYGIHTIESVKVFNVESIEILL